MFGGGLDDTRIAISLKVNGDTSAGPGKEMYLEDDWTFSQFLATASRKLDISLTSRAFTVTGTNHLCSLSYATCDLECIRNTPFSFICIHLHTHAVAIVCIPSRPLSLST